MQSLFAFADVLAVFGVAMIVIAVAGAAMKCRATDRRRWPVSR
jgi:hypothetical protein